MNNKVKIFRKILFLTVILFVIMFSSKVYASQSLSVVEPTEEYKEYMNLSDEEKAKVLEPKKYDVIAPKSNSEYLNQLSNVLRIGNLLENSLDTDYDLRAIILNNVAIRNQMQTDSCWAFAGIGMLESNLGMRDYRMGNTGNIYDFSERHMFYSSKRSMFNNNEVNEYGYTTGISGGNFKEVQNYFINGMGAIKEADMPFENNENLINLSDIQNKDVVTTLYDTIEFESIADVGKAELMAKMKETITNYGGIFAGVHGAQLISDAYNNATGAIYCDSATEYKMDHAVVIIGWDDNYSVENFNETSRPSSNGAWIVKNSWGDKIVNNLADEKQELFDAFKEQEIDIEWNSPEEIPDETVRQLYIANGYGEDKVKINGENIEIEVGDEGYMYISYEDANIYSHLYAVEKASNKKDYDNLYEHDKLLADIPIEIEDSKVYIANKFDRNSNETEYLNKVGFYTLQEVTCNVYVNSGDNSLTKDKLQKVNLKDGDNVVVEPGYHILEFAEPIQLTGDSFAIALELTSGEAKTTFMAETRLTDENVEINANESFFTDSASFERDNWVDLGTYSDLDVRGNVSIRAYTSHEKEEVPVTLESIAVTTAPNKTEYQEGEAFDKTGMVVTATYSDSSSKTITNYEVLDGASLQYGQKYVTISYTENGVTRIVTQAITVTQAEQGGDDDGGDEEIVRPILSDFTNMNTEATEVSIYVYPNSERDSYIDMTIEVSNIINGSDKTNYTYYYYFSDTDSEGNIDNWTKIESPQITVGNGGDKTLTFSVDSRNIPNYSEIKDADKLYLYIKEEATAGDETLEQIAVDEVQQTENTHVNVYTDDENAGSIDDVINIEDNNHNSGNNANGNNSNNEDNTVAGGTIPQTGVITVGIAIVILIGLAIVTYVQHRNIDK